MAVLSCVCVCVCVCCAGLRAAVVILALLLAVPVQLLVSHYFTSSVAAESGRSVKEIRADAVSE